MVFHPCSVYFFERVEYLINMGFGQRIDYSKVFGLVFIALTDWS